MESNEHDMELQDHQEDHPEDQPEEMEELAGDQLEDDEEMDGEESDLNESGEEEEFERLLAQIKETKDKISLNPLDYDSYLRLIELCRAAGDLDEMREARERMSAAYPLTPELWQAWLEDEIKFKENDEENAKIVELFERAIEDYLSVEVWLQYVNFALSLPAESGVDVGQIFERALTSVGLHPIKGQQIWEPYLIYEQMMVEFVPEKEKQLKRVLSLYQRQLSIPNMDLDNTYKAFEDWSQTVSQTYPKLEFDSAGLKAIYLKASAEWANIQPFEEKLICEKPPLASYLEYLDYELKAKNPSRVRFLFERAITDHCLEPDLWLRYVRYLQEQLNIYDLIVAVLRRAVRNVTWCSELWVEYMRTIERFERPDDEVKEVFERSLTAVFQAETDYAKLWLAYLEFRRRKTDFGDAKQVEQLRKNFDVCAQHLAAMPSADPYSTISIYQAQLEAKFCSNIEKCREIWEAIMENHKVLGSNQATYWLEYANLERSYGSREHYRKIMLRALGYCPDSYDLLSGQLIRCFKEESNSIKEIDAVEKSVRGIFERVVKRYREKQQEKQESKTTESTEPRGIKRKDAAAKSDPKGNKRSKPDGPSGGRPAANQSKSIQSKPATGPSTSDVRFPKKPESDDSKLYTIFVKNLDYKVGEERLKEEFSKFGNIKDVRLVKNFKGESKGYCYIEFDTIEAVKNAIKHDRMLIDERPTFISECDVKSEFKYKTDLEKNKLFVSKLDRKVTQDRLTEIFGKLSGFKEVRLATYRDGKSKGHAYVEFQTDRDASKALLETDGMEIEKKKIAVAISDPPKIKKEKNEERALGDAVFKKPMFG